MDNNPIGTLMQNTMESVKNILKVDTVVGDPIYTPDGITLVPISKISVGFGGGGVEFSGKKPGDERPYGGGNATGVKIDLSGDKGRRGQNDKRDPSRQQHRGPYNRPCASGDGPGGRLYRQAEKRQGLKYSYYLNMCK